MNKKMKVRWTYTILVGVICISVCLTACRNSTNSSDGDSLSDNTEVVENVIQSTTNSNVVVDAPEDFLEFQNYIGKDISIFGVKAGLDEYAGWKSSLYGHSGTVEIGVGWDGRTINRAVIKFDSKESVLDDFDKVNGMLEETFGEAKLSDGGGLVFYSGKTDFDFNLSRRSGSSAICWNEDNRKIYEAKNPNASQQNTSVTQMTKNPCIGMTQNQVLESTWGRPTEINKRTTKYGVSEQWVYRARSKTKYIYFDDYVVTAIQE